MAGLMRRSILDNSPEALPFMQDVHGSVNALNSLKVVSDIRLYGQLACHITIYQFGHLMET